MSGSNTKHHSIEIVNNTFDLDPYLKNSNRGSNGTWAANGGPTAILIQSANGIVLGGGNTFKNLCRISDLSLTGMSTLTGTGLHINGFNSRP